MNTQRFTGKTIVVTGAASGIGRATATRLVTEGARVIATDITEVPLKELATELGDRLVPVVGDVTDYATIDAILAAAQGKLNGLANVAGIMDAFLPVGEVDDELWDRVMQINLTGPMRLIRAALPLLLAAGNGSIVNVASEASLRGSAAGVAYTASKHAVVGLTKSVAFMYGPQGIRANAVAPGPTATGIEAQMKSELAVSRVRPLLGAVGLQVAQASDLAASIVWLLSDEAANINGAILPSDGGWSVA